MNLIIPISSLFEQFCMNDDIKLEQVSFDLLNHPFNGRESCIQQMSLSRVAVNDIVDLRKHHSKVCHFIHYGTESS